MNSRESLEQLLNWLTTASTRFRPKNSELVEKSLLAAELFAEAPEGIRGAISLGVSQELRKKLLAASGFMAEAAINSFDPKWIRGAVCLHLIENFSSDYRENFRYLVLISYAAKKIGISMSDAVVSVTSVASNRSMEYLENFCKRNDSLNDLYAFGVKEEVVGGISRFVPA